MTFYERIVLSGDVDLLEEKKIDVKKQIEKAATATAGVPLTVSKVVDLGAKGADFHFNEGGLVKIRPKAEGVVLAKLQGQPKPHYRYKGVGVDGPSALAAMKPEKGKKAPSKPFPKFPKAPEAPKAETPAGKSGPKEANIGGLRLLNDLQVDEATWDRYATAAKDSVELLKRRGFGFMLKNVTMHLRQAKMPGVLGNYDMKKKLVEIFVNTIGWKAEKRHIMFTMVHELGHHYYYREIPKPMRKKYRWYFDLAKKPTEKGKKTGDFVTSYATTQRYEDFAEIFAAYIGKGHHLSSKYKLTRDSMDRFKTFLAFDKRIDLREDDELVGADLLLADLNDLDDVASLAESDLGALKSAFSDKQFVWDSKGRGRAYVKGNKAVTVTISLAQLEKLVKRGDVLRTDSGFQVN